MARTAATITMCMREADRLKVVQAVAAGRGGRSPSTSRESTPTTPWYCSRTTWRSPGRVQVFDSAGRRMGIIHAPEVAANLTLGD